MITPAGKECRYYYEDFHRGRSVQECRMLARARDSLPWEPRVCEFCPVPDILRANGCVHMVLHGRLVRRLFRRRVIVRAHCVQYDEAVENPYVGCGRCHPAAAAILTGKGGEG
ncbi:MAG: hypothetical protein JW900_10840 [Anaerolineae bacterium]|nr:hypothetical protein [Anaerolineae bacterium]